MVVAEVSGAWRVRTIRLTLAYDGTAYVGWQRQAQGVSIQGLIETALTRVEGAPVAVAGAGRTDAGVHARGQVASARVSTALDMPTLRRALNANLPPDIRVIGLDVAPDQFHARFDAQGKVYEYWIWQSAVMPPHLRTWCWHIRRPLDAGAMDRAARMLEGAHDFAAFQATRSDVTTTTRTIREARVTSEPPPTGPWGGALTPFSGHAIVVRAEADGFLRHMVRAIVGTLVEIGDGTRRAESIPEVLKARDRTLAGPTAPAHGLVLVRVDYPHVAPAVRTL